MDDPELALDLQLERLDNVDSEQEFGSPTSDSEVNGNSVVDSSGSVEPLGSVFPIPNVNKEQAYALYRHLMLQQQANPRTNSLQNSVSGSEDNSSIASYE
jgi:hypothetical protein